jgi:hypothetical protein
MRDAITGRANFLHRCRIRGRRIGSREFPFTPGVQFPTRSTAEMRDRKSPTNSGGKYEARPP